MFRCKHKKKDGRVSFLPGRRIQFAEGDGSANKASYEYELSGQQLQKSVKNLAAILGENDKRRIFQFSSLADLEAFLQACNKALSEPEAKPVAGTSQEQVVSSDKVLDGRNTASTLLQQKEQPIPRPARTEGLVGRESEEQPTQSDKPQVEVERQEQEDTSKASSKSDRAIEAFLAGEEDNLLLHRLLDAHATLFEELVIEAKSHTPFQFLKHVLDLARRSEQELGVPRAARHQDLVHGQPSKGIATTTTVTRSLGLGGHEGASDDIGLGVSGRSRSTTTSKVVSTDMTEAVAKYLGAFAVSSSSSSSSAGAADAMEFELDAETCACILRENPNLSKIYTKDVLREPRRFTHAQFWQEFVLKSNYFLALQAKPLTRKQHPAFDPFIPRELLLDKETKSSGSGLGKVDSLLAQLDDPNDPRVVQNLAAPSHLSSEKNSSTTAGKLGNSWKLTQWNNEDGKMLGGAEQGLAHSAKTRILNRVNQLSAGLITGGSAAGQAEEARRSIMIAGEDSDDNEMAGIGEFVQKYGRGREQLRLAQEHVDEEEEEGIGNEDEPPRKRQRVENIDHLTSGGATTKGGEDTTTTKANMTTFAARSTTIRRPLNDVERDVLMTLSSRQLVIPPNLFGKIARHPRRAYFSEHPKVLAARDKFLREEKEGKKYKTSLQHPTTSTSTPPANWTSYERNAHRQLQLFYSAGATLKQRLKILERMELQLLEVTKKTEDQTDSSLIDNLEKRVKRARGWLETGT
ncbi:unnamed protein product [Amoebophrya sp. A25]|nr:unnamed protein product [Amoebophrya sp. A25]|eukprot:GSA25T00018102001.1